MKVCFDNMGIKFLKILTLIIYMGIPVVGDHVGGPLILMLLISLFTKAPLVILMTSTILIILGALLVSIFRPYKKHDIVWIPIGLVLMASALGPHTFDLITHDQLRSTTPFFITFVLFVIFSIFWTLILFRSKRIVSID